MFLDFNQRDQAAALAPQPNEGTHLPATFGDTFGAAWSEGRLFGQSVAGENARAAALQDYLDDIKSKTGKDLTPQLAWEATTPGVGSVPMPAASVLDQANTAVGKIKADNPTADVAPLSAEDLEQRAVAKSRQAVREYEDMSSREKTLGGKLGGLAGGVAAAATDPINIAALPVAPAAELGLLATALRWGAIAGGAQAGIEYFGAPFHEEVQPGYGESGQPIANILEAAGGGALLGGGFKVAGNLWTRAKTGSWPTSVRDAGNVVESEAHLADSNPLPGSPPPVAEGNTRFYHGGDDPTSGGARWVTPNIEYARNYRPGESLHYVDVPNDSPLLKKSFDDAGTDQVAPFVSFEAPEAIAKKLKPYGEGAAPEVAHREAVTSAIDSVAAGKPVDVAEHITPEMTDGVNAKLAAAEHEGERLPPEMQALSEKQLGEFKAAGDAEGLTGAISKLAKQGYGVKLAPDEAAAMAQHVMTAPDAAAIHDVTNVLIEKRLETKAAPPPKDAVPEAPQIKPEAFADAVKSSDMETALRSDIDRARAEGDVQVHMGADENGKPITQSLDSLMEDVDADRKAAEHLEGCINPAAGAAE